MTYATYSGFEQRLRFNNLSQILVVQQEGLRAHRGGVRDDADRLRRVMGQSFEGWCV